jgi:hypothetical protein
MVTIWAGVTVTVTEALMEPLVAVTTAVPTVFPVSRPDELTAATAVFWEDQVTELVTSDVEPSVNLAVACSCCDRPAAREGFDGVTAMDIIWAAVTVMVTEPLIEPLVAVITAVPVDCPVTRPEALTVATAAFWEDQVTEFVRSEVEPFDNVPVAVSCCVSPAATLGDAGATWIELSVGDEVNELPLPEHALRAKTRTDAKRNRRRPAQRNRDITMASITALI